MKKNVILVLSLNLITSVIVNAQDILAKWSFPDTSANSIVDESISINSSRFISCEKGSGFTVIPIDYAQSGSEILSIPDDKCATTSDYENGADSVYWMVKLRTVGYTNIKVSSKQWSSLAPAGPKDFKLQYKLSGGSSPWNDLTNITVGNDWTTGEIIDLLLPAACDNQSSNISLRWIMTSNTDILGGNVAANASSAIDEITITGELITGINSTDNINNLSIYPNPSRGNFVITNNSIIKSVKVVNSLGSMVLENNNISKNTFKIENLSRGFYTVEVTTDNEKSIHKVVVE